MSSTKSLRELHQDPAFIRVLLGTYQHMCWEHTHVEGGADTSAILRYEGTGHGAPGYISRSLTRWNSHPDHGWIPVAVVHVDGTITHPDDKDAPAAGCRRDEGMEDSTGKGYSTSDRTGGVKP